MYKIIFSIALAIGFQVIGFSQWEEINISTNSTLTSVHFWNNDIGYVAGGNNIFKTENGGVNWETNFSASLIFFEDLFMIDAEKIIAVGKDFNSNKSIIFKTENAGANWESVNVSTSSFLKSVYFPSSDIGYCSGAGGTILKSIDSGGTWQEMDSGSGINLQSIFFVNEFVGVAVGGLPAVILKTQDGGNNWSPIDSPANSNLQSTYFINEEIGYAVGWDGAIIKTENCGDSWTVQTSVAMSGNLEIVFTDDYTGYIVGGQMDESLIQKTTNGGELWKDISPQIAEGLISIYFPTFNVGYAVGSNGTIVKTETGGVVTTTENPFYTSDVNIFPNPVREKLWIQSKGSSCIKLARLYNSNGILIEEVKCNSSNTEINLTNLESNIYYLEVHLGNNKTIKKIVKK